MRDPKTYRARFSGMKPKEGQIDVIVPGEFTIEVFQATKERWEARYLKARVSIKEIRGSTKEGVQTHVEASFAAVVQPWQTFNYDGTPYIEARPATGLGQPV